MVRTVVNDCMYKSSGDGHLKSEVIVLSIIVVISVVKVVHITMVMRVFLVMRVCAIGSMLHVVETVRVVDTLAVRCSSLQESSLTILVNTLSFLALPDSCARLARLAWMRQRRCVHTNKYTSGLDTLRCSHRVSQ